MVSPGAGALSVEAGGSGEAETMGMVTSPGAVTGKVVPEMTTAVDPGGTEVVKNEVMWVKDVTGAVVGMVKVVGPVACEG